ncbi:HAD-like protein [Whalleya microplaca]|nr:HAD-like protein [Whalleya microplaca]
MAPRTDFPPIRACLFDMDGLLLDTEDLYTVCINLILEKYGRPSLPWSIKAKLQGRPAPEANALFHEWARLPIPESQYLSELTALQQAHFPTAKPLAGIEKLLGDLGRTRWWDVRDGEGGVRNGQKREGGEAQRVHIALATSSTTGNFAVKTERWTELFSVFESHRRVLGDDPRIQKGRGKPLPDIYFLALKTINDSLELGEKPITPEECLVFEDSVPGVEAGRRAGMRVVWCPHPMLKKEYEGREREILAGKMGEAGGVDEHHLGELDDGWADYFLDLTNFPYDKYGVVIPPAEVELHPSMRADTSAELVTQDTRS